MTDAGEQKKTRQRWSVPLAHPTYSVEWCPFCDFPEADGGSCPNCGWTRSCGCVYCVRIRRRARGERQ